MRSSQATHAAVDNSAPHSTRPDSTYKSGKVVQTSGATSRYGAPEIFNTDQGSQFTADDFTRPLQAKGVRVSMDGKGRWVDNVFVERLWRSVKYEDLYLHAYETMRELKAALANYFDFYNARRPHQSLDYRTPDEMYFRTNEMKKAA